MVDVFKCERAAVYHNTARLTPSQIKAKTGCTHVLNAGFFVNDPDSPRYFEPLSWLVIDGEIISRDEYYDYGFALGNGWGPEMTSDRTETHIYLVPILKDGKRLMRELNPDVARSAERSAVGWFPNGRLLLWCDKAIMDRRHLQDVLLSYGCTDALMCDGGGSVQGDFPDEIVESSRMVPTYLLFWAEGKEKENNMSDVKTYSLKTDGSKYLTQNFQVREFACNDGSDTILISVGLVELLQKIRNHFGKPVVINSAYRTKAYNTKIGGAANSQHVNGTAADIVVAGVDPLTVAQYAEYLRPNSGGIGVYQTFTHVDDRDSRSRWDNRSGKEVVVDGWPGYAEPTEADLAVSWVQAKGILKGDANGELLLDQPVTRRQFAVMLYRYDQQRK